MATEVVMPKLGLTMESGTISTWLVNEGEEVKKGQALVEIETDKVTMEVEAQADGLLRKILIPVGVEVPVSAPIGVIAGPDEDIGAYLDKAPAQVATVAEQTAPTASAAANMTRIAPVGPILS